MAGKKFTKTNIELLWAKLKFGLYICLKFMKKYIKNILWSVIILLCLLLLGIGGWMVSQSRAVTSESGMVTVRIPSGATLHQVADSLVAKHLLKNKTIFLMLAKIKGKEKSIRSGIYDIPKNLDAPSLLTFLETAKTKQFKVTLPEGITSHKMAQILAQTVGVDSAKFVSLVYDSAFAQTLVPGVPNLEGFLLPETYYFEWQPAEREVIRRLVTNTLAIFKPDSVQERLKLYNWHIRDALTLASIIEGEAVVDSERVIISSLYHNRLKRGMLLQADPTIQFALPGPPRRLLYKDLELDSPYNTYKYPGLPPGPINNPGKASILAALFPADTPYLYMVAYGDGRHVFSKTLSEHNRWHARFNQIRKEVARKKKQSAKSDDSGKD
jgi:UPF0755 protein